MTKELGLTGPMTRRFVGFQVFNNGRSELFKKFYAPEIVEHMLVDTIPILRKAFQTYIILLRDQIAEGWVWLVPSRGVITPASNSQLSITPEKELAGEELPIAALPEASI